MAMASRMRTRIESTAAMDINRQELDPKRQAQIRRRDRQNKRCDFVPTGWLRTALLVASYGCLALGASVRGREVLQCVGCVTVWYGVSVTCDAHETELPQSPATAARWRAGGRAGDYFLMETKGFPFPFPSLL